MSSDQSTEFDDANPPMLTSSPEADTSVERFPIVGVGASAGGLEAFTQLLHHLPSDTGMAFVLVQHLAPNHPSLLSDILAQATIMPVHEAQNGTAVEPNQVYVIPPNTTMTIAQGTLHLTPREKSQKSSQAIDTFLNSLAEERGDKAIAVILSGGNFDGTQGLEAIKAVGGITFAQSAESAQVNSMPHAAIATGQVDFILPPEAIAAELARISCHPYITSPISSNVRDASADQTNVLATIFTLLQTTFGVDFTHYKRTTIQRRIFRRMALQHLEQLADYLGYLQDNLAEVQALYQEILIQVTSFFRDATGFEALKREIFPVLLRDRPTEQPIRIWVAGCSTGEEAYSIAICLLEFLAYQPRQPQIQIFATDINEQAIDHARTGIYLPNQMNDVSPDLLRQFFVPIEGGYQISKAVRERCVFARQNLISDPPFSRMDLISCRNVLIYFDASLQKKVLPMFHYGLKPTGFLMLGASETVGEFSNLFHVVDRKHKIYTKQSTALLLPMDLEQINYPMTSAPLFLASEDPSQQSNNLSNMADQIVLSQYAPVGVVVNNQLDIIQFRGQMGHYLEPSPGQASLNLLNMVKEELRLDLRATIYQARQEQTAVHKEGIPMRDREQLWQVRIDVVPIKPGADSDDYFLILLSDTLAPAVVEDTPPAHTTSARKKKSREQAEILRLQQELETTKAHLRSIIEEQEFTNQDLRAANEEILSSNEELQSTNEELQTAKEEIQATNEELSTINDELYRRNAETTQVSNDFQNLLSSIHIPILMLEADLQIRRFTTTAAKIFNLIPTDIGRPLSDIKHNLTITDLEMQILEVINTLTLKTQEVQDQEGHWYDLRIRPYRTLDNRIDGAVVVLVEIDALKRATEQLSAARDYADAIVQTVRESLLVLNAELRVITANQRFYDTFQVTPSETEHFCIFDLGNGQWNIPQLRSLLEELLPQNTQIEDFQVTHKFEYIGQKTMRLNARIMFVHGGEQLILLAIEDISDREIRRDN